MISLKKKLLLFLIPFFLISPTKGSAAWDMMWISDCNYEECLDFFNQVYIGVDGGWSTGLFKSDRSLHSGPFNFAATSVSYGIDLTAGYHAGANIGYVFHPCLRAEISYNFLKHKVQWQTAFLAAATNSFDAHLRSHLLLGNLCLHFNNFCHGGLGFSPYFTGGLGVVFNELGSITERDFSAAFFATDQGHTSSHFAARFGLGMLKPFCYRWALDMGLNFNYLGRVQSGKTQNLLRGTALEIKPYRFTNIWVLTLYIGLKYHI